MIKKLQIRRGTTAAAIEINLKFSGLKVAGVMPSKVDCSLDTVGQHTIQWQGPIAIKGETPAGKGKTRRSSVMSDLTSGNSLPTGSCNLYTYPTITVEAIGEDGKVAERKYKVEGAQLQALHHLVRAIFLSKTEALSRSSDEVGAFPIHALVVGNTPEALELATEIFEAKPSLLTILHTTSRAGLPLFCGESTLHILCVNQREAMLVRLLALAQEKLGKSELDALLHSQANGIFFESQPMRIYGSTALSYACVFDMREAIESMLATGLVSLNSQRSRCKLTGFLPLHAVIANGRRSVFEWLTKQLPWEQRGDASLITSRGSIRGLSLQSLNAMQLAAKLGQSQMFMEILRQQCNVQWVWGPVTCYRINLTGIDSAGGGAGDIMELVGELGARRALTEMLLDTFMDGFLHKLFEQKMAKFGWRIYFVRRMVDVAWVVCLAVFGFCLKSGSGRLSIFCQPLAIATAGCMGVNVVWELEVAARYYRDRVTGPAAKPPGRVLRDTLAWMKGMGVLWLFVSYAFTAGALLLFTFGGDDVHPWTWDEAGSGEVLGVGGGGSIEGGDGGGEGSDIGTGLGIGERRSLRGGGSATASDSAGDPLLAAMVGAQIDDLVQSDGVMLSALWLLYTLGSFLGNISVLYITTMTFEARSGVRTESTMRQSPFHSPLHPYQLTPFRSTLHTTQNSSVLLLSIAEILRTDLKNFLFIFIFLLLAFYLALYFLYPRSGSALLLTAPSFNDPITGAQALVELAFFGANAEIKLREIFDSEVMNWMSSTNTVLWVLTYIMYTLIALICLLNLLIAMLSETFGKVQEEATLAFRVAFARSVLKFEMTARYFCSQNGLFAGERTPQVRASHLPRLLFLIQ